MCGGKNVLHAQAAVPDEEPRASGSGTHKDPDPPIRQDNSGSSITQPTVPDERSISSTGNASSSNSGLYQNVLTECNSLVEQYRKGETPKATVYVEIQSKLVGALRNDRARTDAAFGSFIATIESHHSEIDNAVKRGGMFNTRRRSTSPAFTDPDEHQSNDEHISKKPKIDESVFAWISGRRDRPTVLSDNLSKTLKLIDAYTIDPKATKRSLVNQPDCPEFPDSEWKNVVSGRAVNLDAVLSGQLSTTNDDLKIEKFGDLVMRRLCQPTASQAEPAKIFNRRNATWLT